MKEHGMLLSDPMVLARSEKRKTQTRRLITAQNTLVTGPSRSSTFWKALDLDLGAAWVDPGPSPAGNPGPYLKAPARGAGYQDTVHRLYPHIQPGDRIWWRECHKVMYTDSLRAYPVLQDGRPVDPGTEEEQMHSEFPMSVPIYRATDPRIDLVVENDEGDDQPVPWTPSLFMPRKWARFVDTVVRVWPERLQKIRAGDAVCEGVRWNMVHGFWDVPGTDIHSYASAPDCYRLLFERINGPEAWERNAWVWVYEWLL